MRITGTETFSSSVIMPEPLFRNRDVKPASLKGVTWLEMKRFQKVTGRTEWVVDPASSGQVCDARHESFKINGKGEAKISMQRQDGTRALLLCSPLALRANRRRKLHPCLGVVAEDISRSRDSCGELNWSFFTNQNAVALIDSRYLGVEVEMGCKSSPEKASRHIR